MITEHNGSRPEMLNGNAYRRSTQGWFARLDWPLQLSEGYRRAIEFCPP